MTKSFKKAEPCPLCGGFSGAYSKRNKCRGFWTTGEKYFYCEHVESDDWINPIQWKLYKHRAEDHVRGDSCNLCSPEHMFANARGQDSETLSQAQSSTEQSTINPLTTSADEALTLDTPVMSRSPNNMPSGLSSALSRTIVAEEVSYPQEGVWREEKTLVWYVVKEDDGREVTRSLRREVAEQYLS